MILSHLKVIPVIFALQLSLLVFQALSKLLFLQEYTYSPFPMLLSYFVRIHRSKYDFHFRVTPILETFPLLHSSLTLILQIQLFVHQPLSEVISLVQFILKIQFLPLPPNYLHIIIFMAFEAQSNLESLRSNQVILFSSLISLKIPFLHQIDVLQQPEVLLEGKVHQHDPHHAHK